MSETLVMNQPAAELQTSHNWALKAMALGTTVVLAAGCSGNSNQEKENNTSNQEATQTLENTCGTIDFSQNYADKHFGAPTAIFGNLYTDTNGKKELFNSDQASKSLKATVAQDYRALAHIKAFVFDTRSAVTPADLAASNIERNAQNLIAKYEANPESIKADVAEVCNGLAPAFITVNDKFRVARNLTSEAVFERDGGKVTKTGIIPSATPGTLRGFQINPNFDDGGNADRRDSLEELASSILITADGKLLIKLTTGPLMFDISKKSTTTPVDIKIGSNEQITVKPNNKTEAGSDKSSSSSNSGKTGGTNGNTGSTGTTTGSTPEKNNGPAGGNAPGNGSQPEAAPNGTDNTPGGSTGPSSGPNSGPSTGPTGPNSGPTGPNSGPTAGPAPQETQPAPQQTQPAPQETQPAPQQTQPAPQPSPKESTPPPQPSSEPSPQKSGTPCDPNAGDVC